MYGPWNKIVEAIRKVKGGIPCYMGDADGAIEYKYKGDATLSGLVGARDSINKKIALLKFKEATNVITGDIRISGKSGCTEYSGVISLDLLSDDERRTVKEILRTAAQRQYDKL